MDASKCFDRVHQAKALVLAQEMDLDKNMLRGVAAYLRDLTRFFSCGQFISRQPMRPSNGLLQGDPLSVLLCCVCVQSWVKEVKGEGIQLQAYIDDRTLAAKDLQVLLAAWKRSQAWNLEHQWKVNIKKTHVLLKGTHAEEIWREQGDQELHKTSHCVILGQDILTDPRRLPDKQRQRIAEAIGTCQKLQRIKLTPEVNQKTLSAAVLPKVAYGLQAGGIPRTLLKKLRGAIKAALGYSHRIHSWEALCIVANPGHRLDPEAYQMYCHLSAVIRGLRDSEDAQEVWTLLHRKENVHPCWKYGPLCTAQHFLEELGISWDRGGLIWRFRREEVHLLDTALPKTLHFLRDTIRHWLARKAQQARPHLDGLSNTDFEESRKLTKKRGYTYRKELIALLADGVWTNRKRYLCGHRQDKKCEHCGAEVENLPHILYQCPK